MEETLFPNKHDVRTAYLLTKDYCRRFFPRIAYKRLLTTEKEVDQVHGEIIEPDKEWAEPILVQAFVEPTLIGQPLTKFGIDEFRVCDLTISIGSLVDAGLADLNEETFQVKMYVSIGDLFTYGGKEFSVLTIIPKARWANTDIILFYEFHSEVYRIPSQRFVK